MLLPILSMDNSHFKKLFDVEQAIGKLITKAKEEKLYLEEKLAKLSDFQSATTKVDGLPEGAFDGVQILIEQLSGEIESRTILINKYSEELKEAILDYFKKYLSNVELSTELKEMAEKYGFIPNANQLNPDQSQVFADLLKLDKIFESDVENFEKLQNTLVERKMKLLEYKEGLTAVMCPELNADIESVDRLIQDIDANIQNVQKQVDHLKTSIARALKRNATEQPDSTVQPKKAVAEPMPNAVEIPAPGNEDSSTFNFDGLFDTSANPQKVVGQEGDTSDADAIVEQEDNQAE